MKIYVCISCKKKTDNPTVSTILAWPQSVNKKILQCPYCNGKVEEAKNDNLVHRSNNIKEISGTKIRNEIEK